MLEVENIYIDKLNDKLSKRLRNCLSIQTWTKKKHQLADEIYLELKDRGLSFFEGNRQSYFLYGGIGASLIYKVPKNKRGILADFRGKVVRLICVGNNRYKVVFCIEELTNKDLKKYNYENLYKIK